MIKITFLVSKKKKINKRKKKTMLSSSSIIVLLSCNFISLLFLFFSTNALDVQQTISDNNTIPIAQFDTLGMGVKIECWETSSSSD
jgi:hypothetical protein